MRVIKSLIGSNGTDGGHHGNKPKELDQLMT
jgi:hypothetical protein